MPSPAPSWRAVRAIWSWPRAAAARPAGATCAPSRWSPPTPRTCAGWARRSGCDGDDRAALAAFRRALEHQPADIGSLYWVGVLATRTGRQAESLAAWETILRPRARQRRRPGRQGPRAVLPRPPVAGPGARRPGAGGGPRQRRGAYAARLHPGRQRPPARRQPRLPGGAGRRSGQQRRPHRLRAAVRDPLVGGLGAVRRLAGGRGPRRRGPGGRRRAAAADAHRVPERGSREPGCARGWATAAACPSGSPGAARR